MTAPSPSSSVLPIAVTMGDPAGIGPDIILMAHRTKSTRGSRTPHCVVFGDPAILSDRAAALGIDCSIAETDTAGTSGSPATNTDQLHVHPIRCPAPVTAGHPSTANGPAVIECIEQATAAVVRGKLAALVTAPISKATVYGSGFAHPGHTEFLAALAERHNPGRTYTSVMMIASDVLRVVPLTIHIPLKEVPSSITPGLIETTVRIVHDALINDFAITEPRIAVAGLNPHAGESGTIGREDIDVIAPALNRLRDQSMKLVGPLSGDTMFHAAARATYDAAIGMYHDQMLIPIKTLAFDTGVNVTLGLPFVRTSPDHGTAFDIAGTGKASPASYLAALDLAAQIAANRSAAYTIT